MDSSESSPKEARITFLAFHRLRATRCQRRMGVGVTQQPAQNPVRDAPRAFSVSLPRNHPFPFSFHRVREFGKYSPDENQVPADYVLPGGTPVILHVGANPPEGGGNLSASGLSETPSKCCVCVLGGEWEVEARPRNICASIDSAVRRHAITSRSACKCGPLGECRGC